MSAGSTTANIKVWQPTGYFTAPMAKQMQEQFKQDLQAGVRFALMDLQNVSFMDSFGLGILVSMHTRLKMAGGKLYLCNLSGAVNTLFELSDMHRLFTVVSDYQAFLDHLNSR